MKQLARKTFAAKRRPAATAPEATTPQPDDAKVAANSDGNSGANSDDGRHAPRKAMRSVAFLRPEGSRSQVSCLVQDISATGARLQVEMIDTRPYDASMSLPDSFKLILPNDRIEIDCKLAWQRAEVVGIEFVSNFRPIQSAAKSVARQRAAEQTSG